MTDNANRPPTRSDLIAALPDIRRRVEAITPGTWDTYFSELCLNRGTPEYQMLAAFKRYEDASFCAHAPDDVRTLLALVDMLLQQDTRQKRIMEALDDE